MPRAWPGPRWAALRSCRGFAKGAARPLGIRTLDSLAARPGLADPVEPPACSAAPPGPEGAARPSPQASHPLYHKNLSAHDLPCARVSYQPSLST